MDVWRFSSASVTAGDKQLSETQEVDTGKDGWIRMGINAGVRPPDGIARLKNACWQKLD